MSIKESQNNAVKTGKFAVHFVAPECIGMLIND